MPTGLSIALGYASDAKRSRKASKPDKGFVQFLVGQWNDLNLPWDVLNRIRTIAIDP